MNQYNSQQSVQVFLLSYPSAFLVAIALGLLGFSQHPHWIEFVLGAMLYYGTITTDYITSAYVNHYSKVSTRRWGHFVCSADTDIKTRSVLPKFHSFRQRIPEDILLFGTEYVLHARSNALRCLDEQLGTYFRRWATRTDASQSLLTIHQAIHMAFDCLAIGVGLLASVMAKWPPNERFTYGWVFGIFQRVKK
jgi:solute carrier family 30 (zinc transporter), member 5/7